MHRKTLASRIVSFTALKPALIVLLSASLLLINMDDTRACTCMPQSPSEAFESADVVFSAHFVASSLFYKPSASVNALADGAYNVSVFVYELKVNSVWKGELHEHVYVVNTVHPCGWRFDYGEENLVYAHVRANHLEVHECGRTRPLASAQEDLAELGEGRLPEAGTRAPRPSMGSWLAPFDMVERLAGSVRDLRYELEQERSSQREPTPTAAPTASPAPTQEPAASGDAAGAPEWLISTVAGIAGVLVGVLATTLTLRRRRDGI